MGQRLERLHKCTHNRPGLPIIIAQEDSKAADPLHERRHVGLAELLAKLDQIALPMPELLAVGDNLWATQNIEFRVKAFQSAAFEGLTEDRTRSCPRVQKLLAS